MVVGWRVIVEMQTEEGGRSNQFFLAHISDRNEAVEAVKSRFSAENPIKAFAIEPLFIKTFEDKRILKGEIGS